MSDTQAWRWRRGPERWSTLPNVAAAELLEDYETTTRLGLPEAAALRVEVLRRLEVGRGMPPGQAR